MAGFYSDVPAPRMVYDIDGSVGFRLNHPGTGGPAVILTPAELASLNSEGPNGYAFTSWNTMSTGIIFPQLRDIVGFTLQALQNHATDWSIDNVATSTDTTNGVDGTWTSRAGIVRSNIPENPNYRLGINVVNWPGIIAIRWRCSSNGSGSRHGNAHVYGTISAGLTPDRLRMWHPTLDEPLDDNTTADGAHLDWGNVVRGTTADNTFRIKNNSAALTANLIDITTSVLTDATPAIGPQITYSDGGAFAESINIGSLAPGAISPVITVRRTTPANAYLNVWAWRTLAEAGSWT